MALAKKKTPKGKVLKVRLGYNANSSSLSVMVSMMLLGSAAVVTVLGMINAALATKAVKGGGTGSGDGGP